MDTKDLLRQYALQYNDNKYFTEDPIIFPKKFFRMMENGEASLQDVEISAVIAAHLAWGRRSMIVRDCNRAFDEMGWKPYKYVMESPSYKDDSCSLHRTVMWKDFAGICDRLKQYYSSHSSIEALTPEEIRVRIFGQKPDPGAANKKIHMMRRWMVRDDGKVDIGVWKNTSKCDLIIPLDVHVHRSALNLGITKRNSADFRTASEITEYLKEVFPGDPALGDYALFAVAASRKNE